MSGGPHIDCPAPEEFLGLFEIPVASPVRQDYLRHIDGCDNCSIMMAEAARAMVSLKAGRPPHTGRALADAELVSGRYEILRFVARGGMGEVYEALDTTLHERVALKTLPVSVSDQADASESLVREVRIARKVTHPNVCRILEFGVHRDSEEGGRTIPYLTMDFLSGETLAHRLRQVGRLPARQVLIFVRDLVFGLRAIHEAGIVHRDFKSENVFIVGAGAGGDATIEPERAVVMDFGLAKMFATASSSTKSNGRLIGTPLYMAPEQLRGRPATFLSDLYALGIVTFEMLTGRHPFHCDTTQAATLSRLHNAVKPPSCYVQDLDPRWDLVLEKCLAREPRKRFQTLDELAEAVALMSAVPLTRRWRASRRRAAIAFLIGGIASVTLWAGGRGGGPPGEQVAATHAASSSATFTTSPAGAATIPPVVNPTIAIKDSIFSIDPQSNPRALEDRSSKAKAKAKAKAIDLAASESGSGDVRFAPQKPLRRPARLSSATHAPETMLPSAMAPPPSAHIGASDVPPAAPSGEVQRDLSADGPPTSENGDPMTPRSSGRSHHPDDLVDPFDLTVQRAQRKPM